MPLGAVPLLVTLGKADQPAVQIAAAAALDSLACSPPHNKGSSSHNSDLLLQHKVGLASLPCGSQTGQLVVILATPQLKVPPWIKLWHIGTTEGPFICVLHLSHTQASPVYASHYHTQVHKMVCRGTVGMSSYIDALMCVLLHARM